MLIMENKKELKAKANKKYYENNKDKIIQHQKEKDYVFIVIDPIHCII